MSSKWVILEDFELEEPLSGIVNMAYTVRVELRVEKSELIIFFGAQGHTDPHILRFKSPDACQAAYDNLKVTLTSD